MLCLWRWKSFGKYYDNESEIMLNLTMLDILTHKYVNTSNAQLTQIGGTAKKNEKRVKKQIDIWYVKC